ncbi:MAG: arsenate reductase ArsC [Candidatus Bathyarchaeia archaeon]
MLFVCVENSFRSQIAEAYFNRHAPKGWSAVSAGLTPAEKVHPNAVRLMLEEGVDISHKKPRLVTRELQEKAERAIIVCGSNGAGACPVVYAKNVEQWNLPDPAKMPLKDARKVRDEIKRRVMELIAKLQQ